MRQDIFQSIVLVVLVLIAALTAVVAWHFSADAEEEECPPCIILDSASDARASSDPDAASRRDRRVLSDQLYPPLNRADARDYISVENEISRGRLYQNPDSTYDSFRLIGFLSSSTAQEERDAGHNQWKLFGRMKNRNVGEFYIVPAHNSIDIKIPLTQDIVRGTTLRDVYTIPNELSFQSPLLNRSPYIVSELPKADLSSSAIYS